MYFVEIFQKRDTRTTSTRYLYKKNTMKKHTLIIRQETALKIIYLPNRNPIKLSVATANFIFDKPQNK